MCVVIFDHFWYTTNRVFLVPVIHSFIHSFIHSLTHSFLPSVLYSFLHPFLHSFIHPSIHLFNHSVNNLQNQPTPSDSVLYSRSWGGGGNASINIYLNTFDLSVESVLELFALQNGDVVLNFQPRSHGRTFDAMDQPSVF